jgi:formylglycine-generating enzyme required for sulfatase activity
MTRFMRTIIYTLIAALLAFPLAAVPVRQVWAGMGDTICKPYKPLVVQISTRFADDQADGFGFIVGEQDDCFYIVTANHVVRRKVPEAIEPKILLRFPWDPGGTPNKAELLTVFDPGIDLALLRIDKSAVRGAHRISWNGRAWCRQWRREERVWFIGLERKWDVPLDHRAGFMLRREADRRGFVHIDISSIEPGTSGAPLIIKNGIVGMVVTDSGDKIRAVHIDHIRRFVSEENPYPWNLIEHGISSTPEPDTSTQNSSLPTAGAVTTEHSIDMELVYVPEGCFTMGSPDGEKDRDGDEGPVRKVCVDGFRMGKYEVTQEQWRKIMGKNPARFQHGDNYPVEQVSWDDTQTFIRKLNNKTGKQFRLPTEAEWEYAARAGTKTTWVRHWGDDISCDKAMYENNEGSPWDSCVDYARTKGLTPDSTAPVGSYPPNQLGLYDMLGNIWEWCNDWYAKKYDDSSPEKNPQGSATGSGRVMRGGGWSSSPKVVRSADRFGDSPDSSSFNLGFRLVLPGQ